MSLSALESAIRAVPNLYECWPMQEGSGTTITGVLNGINATFNPGSPTPQAFWSVGPNEVGNAPVSLGNQAGLSTNASVTAAGWDLAARPLTRDFTMLLLVHGWEWSAGGLSLSVGYPGWSINIPDRYGQLSISKYGGAVAYQTAQNVARSTGQWNLIAIGNSGGGTDVNGKPQIDSTSNPLFWMNGSLVPSTFQNAVTIEDRNSGNQDLAIGLGYMRGSLAYWAIWPRRLTTAELSSIWAGGSDVIGPRPPRRLQAGLHQDLHYDGYDWRRLKSAQMAQRVRATIGRSSCLWSVIEPAQGTRDYSSLDSIVDVGHEHGTEQMLIFIGSPQWANGNSDMHAIPGGGSATDPAFTSWCNAYEAHVRATVQRYKGRVRLWELWNEPNLSGSWDISGTTPSGTQYATWARQMRAAILQEDPSAQVAAGALSAWIYSGSPSVGARDFLNQAMDAGLDSDIWSIHPYTNANQSPDTNIDYTDYSDTYGGAVWGLRHELCRRYGLTAGRNKTIWISEVGWQSTTSEADQATKTAAALAMWRDYMPGDKFIYFWTHQASNFPYYGLFKDVADSTSPLVEVQAATPYRDFARRYHHSSRISVS